MTAINVNGPATALHVWSGDWAVSDTGGCLWTSNGVNWFECQMTSEVDMSIAVFADRINTWWGGGQSFGCSMDGIVWEWVYKGPGAGEAPDFRATNAVYANNAFYVVTTSPSVNNTPVLFPSWDGKDFPSRVLLTGLTLDAQAVADPAGFVWFVGSRPGAPNSLTMKRALTDNSCCGPIVGTITTHFGTLTPTCLPIVGGIRAALLVGNVFKVMYMCGSTNTTAHVMNVNATSGVVSTAFTLSGFTTQSQIAASLGAAAGTYVLCVDSQCKLMRSQTASTDSVLSNFFAPKTITNGVGYSDLLGKYLLASSNGTSAVSGAVSLFGSPPTTGTITETVDLSRALFSGIGIRTFSSIATGSVPEGSFTSFAVTSPTSTTAGVTTSVERDMAVNAQLNVVPGSTIEVGNVAWINSAANVAGTFETYELIVGTNGVISATNGGTLMSNMATVSTDSTLVVAPGGLAELMMTDCEPGSVMEISLQGNASLGELNARSGSTLRVVGTTAPESNATTSATFVIARLSTDAAGKFSNTLFSVSSGSPCTIASPNGISYGQTALTVTVSFNQIPNCGSIAPTSSPTTAASGGLSTAALIGICVGATVGGIAIILAIIGVIYKASAERRAMKSIQAKLQNNSQIME